ncbi:MAG: ACT domain-containing protein [Desulfobacterales bacterium]|nr:ACT domain-containing protein [Desulfobacterales bacterium]
MSVKQISIFLENKMGRLAEVTSILSEANINIRALSLADTSDFGVLRLIVDNTKKAEESLKNNGFTVGVTDVVAVEVDDKPGGLNAILSILYELKVNVEYMYAYVPRSQNKAVMIFRFVDNELAAKVLKEKGIKVFDADEAHSI